MITSFILAWLSDVTFGTVLLDTLLATILPDDHLGIRQATFLLHVQVFDFQGMGLDEISARLNFVTHEDREDFIDPWHVLEFDPQQRARFGVHRGFPQLTRVHFPQSFVPLDGQPLFAEIEDRSYEIRSRPQFLLLAFRLELIRCASQADRGRRQFLQFTEIR
jgi:hypothetical protein